MATNKKKITNYFNAQSTQSDNDSPTPVTKVSSKKNIEVKQKQRNYMFKEEWLEMPDFKPWLVKQPTNDKENPIKAYCRFCLCSFSIKSNGLNQIKQHASTDKHLKIEAQRPKTDGVPFDEKQINLNQKRALCEATLVFHNVKHNQSYLSMDCLVKVLKTVADDSKTINAILLGRTKARMICKNVLAPLTVKDLIGNLGENPYSLGTDASNKGAAKYWPVVIRYFDLNKGTKHGVLRFFQDHNENSETISTNLIDTIETYKLQNNRMMSYNGDNAPVNFGVNKSVYVHLQNYFKSTQKPIFKGNCYAHILHNACKNGIKLMTYDVETFVLSTVSEFKNYSGATAELRKFCEDFDVENTSLVKHISVRFLSLGYSLEKILKMWQPIKSYFLSQGKDNVKTIIWKFLGDDESSVDTSTVGEAFLYFVHSISSLINKAILYVEGDSVEISEIYDTFDSLRKEFIDRKSKKFFGMETRKVLKELTPYESNKFTKEALQIYEKIIDYLNKWFPFEKNGLLFLAGQVNLQKEIEFSELIKLAELLSVDIDDDLLSEIRFFNSKRSEFSTENISLSKKWSKFLKNVPSPNLQRLIQHLFTIPPNNCYCERIFSSMNRLITDDRNKLSDKAIEAELLLKFNFETTDELDMENQCLNFFNYIQNRPAFKTIVKDILSNSKYDDNLEK
uniref:CSON004940 protein n=1 Tax=Culicoides sonorensis TaxID=179676 RepID=A0A336KBZ5_CULSO